MRKIFRNIKAYIRLRSIKEKQSDIDIKVQDIYNVVQSMSSNDFEKMVDILTKLNQLLKLDINNHYLRKRNELKKIQKIMKENYEQD